MKHLFLLVARILPACVAALVAGCHSLGPDFKAPAWDGPDRWGAVPSGTPPSPVPEGAPWWGVFGDPALNALEEALLVQSPSLAASVARLDSASAALGMARAEAFPSITLSASAARRREADGGVETSKTEWLFTPTANLGWELDFWGRVRRSKEAASAELAAAWQDVRAAHLLLSTRLASTYISLRTLQEQLACARRAEELQASALELAISRVKSSLAGELEERQAEMNLSATRAAIPAIEAQIDAAVNAICALVGDWPGARESLRESAPVPSANAGALPDALPADILRNRPDVAAAIDRLHAETARIGAAKAEMFPKVSIEGLFGFSAARISALSSSGARTWSVGPSVEWPVFAAGRLRNAVRAQEAAVRAAEADFRQTVLDAAAECETVISAHRAACDAIEPLRRSADAAERSAALAESLYRNGLADFKSVLDMQSSLAERRDALAQGLGTASMTLVDVWKAFGAPDRPRRIIKSADHLDTGW